MREGESEYGRGQADRTCGAEDLPAGSGPWPLRASDSGGGRLGDGCQRISPGWRLSLRQASRRLRQVKLPATRRRQGRRSPGYSGSRRTYQIHAGHRSAFLLKQQGRVSTQRLVRERSVPTLRRILARVPGPAVPSKCHALTRWVPMRSTAGTAGPVPGPLGGGPGPFCPIRAVARLLASVSIRGYARVDQRWGSAARRPAWRTFMGCVTSGSRRCATRWPGTWIRVRNWAPLSCSTSTGMSWPTCGAASATRPGRSRGTSTPSPTSGPRPRP